MPGRRRSRIAPWSWAPAIRRLTSNLSRQLNDFRHDFGTGKLCHRSGFPVLASCVVCFFWLRLFLSFL